MVDFTTNEMIKKTWQRNVRIHVKLVEMENETKSLKRDIDSLKYSVKTIHDIVVDIQYKLDKMEKKSNEIEIEIE